jgi:hypothetical protein
MRGQVSAVIQQFHRRWQPLGAFFKTFLVS